MLMTVQPFFFASSYRACVNVPTCFTIGFSRCINGSRFQVELLELLRCRAEVAEVVNGRACRREREVIKRWGEHLVRYLSGGKPGGDVRLKIDAESLRQEFGNA